MSFKPHPLSPAELVNLREQARTPVGSAVEKWRAEESRLDAALGKRVADLVESALMLNVDDALAAWVLEEIVAAAKSRVALRQVHE